MTTRRQRSRLGAGIAAAEGYRTASRRDAGPKTLRGPATRSQLSANTGPPIRPLGNRNKKVCIISNKTYRTGALASEVWQNRKRISLRDLVKAYFPDIVAVLGSWFDEYIDVGPGEQKRRVDSQASPRRSIGVGLWEGAWGVSQLEALNLEVSRSQLLLRLTGLAHGEPALHKSSEKWRRDIMPAASSSSSYIKKVSPALKASAGVAGGAVYLRPGRRALHPQNVPLPQRKSSYLSRLK